MSITIIGILSTIILTSISNSRARAYDSKVKQQLNSFRTAAEIYLSNHDGYGPTTGICGGAMNTTIFNNFEPTSGSPGLYIDPANLPSSTQVVCGATDSAYAVKATLYSGADYWCIDNRGASRMIHDDIGTSATFCP